MTFHDDRIDEGVEKGSKGGLGFNTRITPLDSGHEQRNISWSEARGRWNIGYGVSNEADTMAVKQHHAARFGNAIGFRFKDWMDFEIGVPGDPNPAANHQTIGTGDNAETIFQVFKRYSSGGFNYDHPIYKLVTGTYSVYLDDVLQAEPGDYSANVDTGVITFVTAPGSSVDIAIATEFDFPVRYDLPNDRLEIRGFFQGRGSAPNIPIIEIRDIT